MPFSAHGTAYDLAGPETAPVVTLVHGIGVKRQLWDGFVARLSRRYRVLSYDLLGHGESNRAAETLSLQLFASQLKQLLDELGIGQTTVIGFSMGGMINRRFAIDFPSRARGLVIMNSPHRRDAAAQRLVEERAGKTDAGGPAATIAESMARWFTPEFLSGSHPEIATIREWILANHPPSYTQSRQILATGVLELVDPSPPLDLPALVITCEHDSGSTPQMARAIAAEIDGATCHIVPQLQHLGMLENPQAFLQPIEEFLEGLYGN